MYVDAAVRGKRFCLSKQSWQQTLHHLCVGCTYSVAQEAHARQADAAPCECSENPTSCAARSGSPGGSARRRLYRALHVARPPTLNPKPFTAAPPASPFAAAAAARRLDLDASGFMERRAGAPVATEGYGGLGASSGDDAPSDGSGNCDALGSEGGTGARAAAECRPAALGRCVLAPACGTAPACVSRGVVPAACALLRTG